MTPLAGLSQQEAAARRTAGLGNNVEFRSTRTYGQILRENAFTFINNVLFAIGALLILMGSVDNAIITAGLVLLNVVVGVIQEGRAKRQLDRIALLTRPEAVVRRESVESAVDPSEIVQGDILVVNPGDQIVVDGQVVEAAQFTVDESLLTGESDHVVKTPGDSLLSGTFCVTGRAAYEAVKVGQDSFANQLTKQARTFRRIQTPLQHDIDFVIRLMVLIAAVLGLLLAVSAVLKHLPLVQWVEIAAVIVVIVPQGLFFMTTVTYAAGAVRVAGKGALVQQANAIESLSNVDVLCLDKTGTLTTNRIVLDAVYPLGSVSTGESLPELVGGYVASVSERNRTAQAIADAYPAAPRPVQDEIPFSSEWKWSALRFAAGEEGDGGATYVLGAPEILLPRLAEARDQAGVEETVTGLARQGRRVLLFAQAVSGEALPLAAAEQQALAQAAGDGPVPAPERLARPNLSGGPLLPLMAPLAVLSFSDQLRPEATETLRAFGDAGIAVKIISGDNAETVAALARQAGFSVATPASSGPDLAALDAEALAEAAERGQVFGRITPQLKESLVAALTARGHYVAMVGDGVNDVLSLKKAQLAIAMQAGSQAARSVADIVLLDNSFAALPPAFREGQRILRGMLDIIRLFLARTLYVTLLIIGSAIIGTIFPLTPKHNAILALLTVGIPTLFLAAWARPGRTAKAVGGSNRPGILQSVRHFVYPAAFTVAGVALAVYVGYLLLGRPLVLARTAMTTAMILCGILLIVFVEPPARRLAVGDELSDDRRPTALAAGMLLLYGIIAWTPAFRRFFALAPLPGRDLALIFLLVAAWAVILLYIWRHNLFERLLEI